MGEATTAQMGRTPTRYPLTPHTPRAWHRTGENTPVMEKHVDITIFNETQITSSSVHCMTF